MSDAAVDAQLRILVVDDDADMVRFLTRILHSAGHQVVSASSAEEAMEHLPYFSFQIAFLDHHLPGMAGFVFGEYLRRHNPHMVIALVTGKDDERFSRLVRSHDLLHISKPFDIEEIEAVVTGYLSQAEGAEGAARGSVEDYLVPVSDWHGQLGGLYALPKSDERLVEALIHRLQACLKNLGSVGRYSERDRVAAYAGLLSAQVLGLSLPKTEKGRSLFEEYDALMLARGRRAEFCTKT